MFQVSKTMLLTPPMQILCILVIKYENVGYKMYLPSNIVTVVEFYENCPNVELYYLTTSGLKKS